jgi:hypothetical protein
MNQIKDGGPAFPTGTGVTPHNTGMTLRDYFAAAALQGLIAGLADDDSFDWDRHLEEIAYMVADDMLIARGQ